MQFLPELLYYIVKYIPLDEVAKVCISLCPGIDNSILKSIILDRKNPKYIFRELSSDIPELLDVMVRSGTVLSGLYAENYFNPINISYKDTYEFYCHNHPLSCMRFIEYLKYIGINWITGTDRLKNGPISQWIFKLKGYREFPDGRRKYIHIYWPMTSNATIKPNSMLRIISKGQATQIYTIWGNMAMSSSEENLPVLQNATIFRPPGYIPSPSRSYLVKFNTRDIFQHISMLPSTATLFVDNNKILQLNGYEHKLYNIIKTLAREYQLINIVMAILPYTIRYKPKYMSMEAWNEILTAIIYNHKLTLYV